MILTATKLWSVAFPPVPSCVPELVGFWGPNGVETDNEFREAWANSHMHGDRVRRLFAVACAGRCLERFEANYPGDGRSRVSIETAEWFADLKRPTKKHRDKLEAVWSAAQSAWKWPAGWSWCAGAAGRGTSVSRTCRNCTDQWRNRRWP